MTWDTKYQREKMYTRVRKMEDKLAQRLARLQADPFWVSRALQMKVVYQEGDLELAVRFHVAKKGQLVLFINERTWCGMPCEFRQGTWKLIEDFWKQVKALKKVPVQRLAIELVPEASHAVAQYENRFNR